MVWYRSLDWTSTLVLGIAWCIDPFVKHPIYVAQSIFDYDTCIVIKLQWRVSRSTKSSSALEIVFRSIDVRCDFFPEGVIYGIGRTVKIV